MKLTCRDCDKYLECKFNGRKGSSQICRDFTNNFKMIRELEKIKEEIEGINKSNDSMYCVGVTNVLIILDRHISELKGDT